MPRIVDLLRLSFVLAALLLAVQTLSLSHAAEHGDHPHEHEEGIVCELEVLATSEFAILPEHPVLSPPRFHLVKAATAISHVSIRLWPPERAPPPRGPPVLFQ